MSLLDQDIAVDRLSAYFHALRAAHHDAWTTWLALQPQCLGTTRTTRAGIVHDAVVHNVRTRIPDAREVPIKHLAVFLFGNEIAVRFKKFDGELSPRNNMTEQVLKFRGQQSLDGLPASYHLEVGYVLNSLQTHVESTHLICPSGPYSHAWAISLDEFVESGVVVGAPALILPFTPASVADEKPVVVRPRKKAESEKADDENHA